MILEVTVNGIPLRPDSVEFNAGDRLEARISDEAFTHDGGFYVITTPLATYQTDVDAIIDQNGQTVDLGDVPTVTHRGVQQVAFKLEAATLYDAFYWHSAGCDAVRITTGRFPDRLTLDEVKLMIAFRTGFKPEDLKGISAEVVYDGTYCLNSSGEYLYCGLKVGAISVNVSRHHHLHMNLAPHTGNIDTDFLAERPTFEHLTAALSTLKYGGGKPAYRA